MALILGRLITLFSFRRAFSAVVAHVVDEKSTYNLSLGTNEVPRHASITSATSSSGYVGVLKAAMVTLRRDHSATRY